MAEIHFQTLNRERLESLRHWIVVSEDPDALQPLPLPPAWRQHLQRELYGRGPALAQLPTPQGGWVTRLEAGPGDDTFTHLEAARRAVSPHLARGAEAVAVVFPPGDPGHWDKAADALVSALLCGAHRLPHFGKNAPDPVIPAIHLVGASVDSALIDWAVACAEGNNLARSLTALPSNELTPAAYRERLEGLAQAEGWEMTFFDRYRLRDLGAGAFLAVIRGSAEDDAGIVHLRYRPPGTDGPPKALVGKGVCFDTGGVNLKSARHMFGMHADMAGSAVAVGTLLALTRLDHPEPVDCWLALADNPIGPAAYRPNEVVTTLQGTTVEIVHTDAEGRLLLADTLALAAREPPRLIIDLATLTGSCVQALGDRYAGAFSPDPDLAHHTQALGRETGERVWPFPMDADYDQALESEVADIKQCALETEADHILAARFLSRFVPKDISWLHLDLAPARRKGGLGHIASEITGFGVRLTTRLLQTRP